MSLLAIAWKVGSNRRVNTGAIPRSGPTLSSLSFASLASSRSEASEEPGDISQPLTGTCYRRDGLRAGQREGREAPTRAPRPLTCAAQAGQPESPTAVPPPETHPCHDVGATSHSATWRRTRACGPGHELPCRTCASPGVVHVGQSRHRHRGAGMVVRPHLVQCRDAATPRGCNGWRNDDGPRPRV